MTEKLWIQAVIYSGFNFIVNYIDLLTLIHKKIIISENRKMEQNIKRNVSA